MLVAVCCCGGRRRADSRRAGLLLGGRCPSGQSLLRPRDSEATAAVVEAQGGGTAAA